MKKAIHEDQQGVPAKLKIHSQIVRKILASLNIYRFNSYFYKLLKDVLFYVIERPQSTSDDTIDLSVTSQLCDSEYPEDIYQDLLEHLLPMVDSTPYVIKKKLMFLQGMVINRSFRLDKIDVPPLLMVNEKHITLEFIITLSNILRLMKNNELTQYAERILQFIRHRPKYETYALIAALMASGIREFDWKEEILRDLMKHKKDKLVKEGISEWWKGKSPETAQEYRLVELVRNFENPYSYFA